LNQKKIGDPIFFFGEETTKSNKSGPGWGGFHPGVFSCIEAELRLHQNRGFVPYFDLPAKLARRKMYRVKRRLLCVVQVQEKENACVLLNFRAVTARKSS
jgi:hypothetical protein